MWTYLVRWDNWMGVVPADTVKADHCDECNQWMDCHHVRECGIGRHREVMM